MLPAPAPESTHVQHEVFAAPVLPEVDTDMPDVPDLEEDVMMVDVPPLEPQSGLGLELARDQDWGMDLDEDNDMDLDDMDLDGMDLVDTNVVDMDLDDMDVDDTDVNDDMELEFLDERADVVSSFALSSLAIGLLT